MTVPAGTFEQTVTIRYLRHPCRDSELLEESFAPGVGLVQRQVYRIAGTETWSLAAAVVGGTVIGDWEGNSFSGATPVEPSTWGAIKSAFGR